jgi:hypothetical protein
MQAHWYRVEIASALGVAFQVEAFEAVQGLANGEIVFLATVEEAGRVLRNLLKRSPHPELPLVHSTQSQEYVRNLSPGLYGGASSPDGDLLVTGAWER